MHGVSERPIDVSELKLFFLIHILNTVKITAEDKKNKDYANVAPSTYERTLANKNKEPTWR